MIPRAAAIRLIVGICILIVAALDFRIGQARPALQIAGLAAGGLLVLSALVDWLLATRRAGEAAMPQESRHAPSGPGE